MRVFAFAAFDGGDGYPIQPDASSISAGWVSRTHVPDEHQRLDRVVRRGLPRRAECRDSHPRRRSSRRSPTGWSGFLIAVAPAGGGATSTTLNKVSDVSDAGHFPGYKIGHLGKVTETETVGSLTTTASPTAVTLNRVVETESVGALTGSKAGSLGKVPDVADVGHLPGLKIGHLGKVTETETARHFGTVAPRPQSP